MTNNMNDYIVEGINIRSGEIHHRETYSDESEGAARSRVYRAYEKKYGTFLANTLNFRATKVIK